MRKIILMLCILLTLSSSTVLASDKSVEDEFNRKAKIMETVITWNSIGKSKITLYNHLEDKYGYNTATGIRSRSHETCAVDPNVIPLGSKVRVLFKDGTIREYDAIDVGEAVKGNHIDVFVDDRPLNERWFADVYWKGGK